MGVTPTNVQGVVRSRRETGIVCHEVFYDTGTTLESHTHDTALLAWLMSGSYRESACNSELRCGARSVVFHPPLIEHSVRIESTSRCFAIELDVPTVRAHYGVDVPGSLLHVDGGPIGGVLANLYGEFRGTDACSSLAIQGLMLQVLACLRRRDRPEVVRPGWLDRVDEMLRSDFRMRLTLEDIAAAVGQSPERVSCVFRRFYHRSIAEEQRRLRIEFACERLRDPEVTLAEIALDAGFSDQPHFSRAFKEITGTTPARYRSVAAGQ